MGVPAGVYGEPHPAHGDICAGPWLHPAKAVLGKIERSQAESACKAGRGATCIGPHCADVCIAVFRSCAHNVELALRNRFLSRTVQPEEGAWKALRAWSLTDENPLAPLCRAGADVSQRLTEDEWAARFPIARRRAFEPSRHNEEENIPTQADIFVKREKTGLECKVGVDPTLVPRLIISMSPADAIFTGPTVLAATDSLKSALNDTRFKIACGMDGEQVAAWIREACSHFRDPVAIELDSSKHDKHMHSDRAGVFRDLYRQVDRDRKRVLLGHHTSLLGGRILVAMKAGLRAKVAGAPTFTGATDTTLGNSYAILLPGIYLLRLENAWMIVMGDDVLIICEREDAPMLIVSLQSGYRRFGFVMKGNIHEVDAAVFLQSRLFPSRSGVYTMVPRIGRILARYFRTDRELCGITDVEQCRALAKALLHTAAHCPILNDLAVRVLEMTEGVRDRTLDALRYKVFNSQRHEEALEAPALIAAVYGVPLDHVTEMRRIMRNIPTLNCGLRGDIFAPFLAVDGMDTLHCARDYETPEHSGPLLPECPQDPCICSCCERL